MVGSTDTYWARAKLERARFHLAELNRATAEWMDPITHPLDIVSSEDGWKVEAILELGELPPLKEWSLILGDCVHNVRTALDVFVWANSTLWAEAERRKAAYPILPYYDDDIDDGEALPHRLENQNSGDRKWIERQVAGLPEPLRSRVVENMRWASFRDQGELTWHQRLPFIRELDDADKHRLALSLEASQNSATWSVWARDAEGGPVKFTIDWNLGAVTPTRVGERVVITTGIPDRRVASVGGTATVTFGLRVQLFERGLDVREWLHVYIEDVEGLLDVLSSQ